MDTLTKPFLKSLNEILGNEMLQPVYYFEWFFTLVKSYCSSILGDVTASRETETDSFQQKERARFVASNREAGVYYLPLSSLMHTKAAMTTFLPDGFYAYSK